MPVRGRHRVAARAAIDRVAAARIGFAYLAKHEAEDGTRRNMPIPVNG